jgi:hypothetical protein
VALKLVTQIGDGIMNKTTYVPYEFKAPTDESIRLLNEFSEKAIENIVSNISCDSNICKVVAIIIGYDMTTSRYPKCYCKFILNGVEHQFNFELKFEYHEINNIQTTKQHIGFSKALDMLKENLYEKFSKKIAKILVDNSPEFIMNLKIV